MSNVASRPNCSRQRNLLKLDAQTKCKVVGTKERVNEPNVPSLPKPSPASHVIYGTLVRGNPRSGKKPHAPVARVITAPLNLRLHFAMLMPRPRAPGASEFKAQVTWSPRCIASRLSRAMGLAYTFTKPTPGYNTSKNRRRTRRGLSDARATSVNKFIYSGEHGLNLPHN